ncbi:MAG: LamG domain-containing protein [Lentisphaeria bacterium]|nr:LamG domain-containing protein [Lentisphaeria bacterium]
MGIANEINRIKAAKESLKNVINAKGGNLSNELLDDYADAVAGLDYGPDLSGVTVSPDKLLAGVVAVDSEGVMITGTIPKVTASSDGETVTIPAGFHENENCFSITQAADLSFVTAGAEDILAGKVGADANGNPVAGSIEEVSMQVSDNIVSIRPGYTDGETVSLKEVTVTRTGEKITISKGYNKNERVFDLSNNYTTFYKCTSVDSSNKSWIGRKAVLADGFYSFELNNTGGLKYTSVVPQTGEIYTADALVQIKSLYTNPLEAFVSASFDLTYNMTVNGYPASSENGINGELYFTKGMTQNYALTFNGSSYLDLTGVVTDLLWGDFTIEFGVSLIGPDRRMGVLAAGRDYFIGIDTKDGKYNLWIGDGNRWYIHADWNDGSNYGGGTIAVKNATAQHLAITREASTWKLYVDGKLSVTAVSDVDIGEGEELRLGRWGNDEYGTYGKLEKFNIYKNVLDASQISSIAQKYIDSRSSNPDGFSVFSQGTAVLVNGQGGRIIKKYDGWALAGIMDVVSPVFMTGVILVAEDAYSCLYYAEGFGDGTAVSFDYNGKTYYYSVWYADLGKPKEMFDWPYLDAVVPAEAARELLDRHNNSYHPVIDRNCNLYVYRAGIEGVNGKYINDATFGGESVYRNGSYYMKKREYGNYWVICSDNDPDMPLYAACTYDENIGEYVPTENILGPWISMMGSQPPPRVIEGDWGAFGL